MRWFLCLLLTLGPITAMAEEVVRSHAITIDLAERLLAMSPTPMSKIFFANSGQKWTFYGNANSPVDDWNCRTDLLDDDGSAESSPTSTSGPVRRP